MEVATGSTFECSKQKRYQLMCMTFFNKQFVRNSVRDSLVLETEQRPLGETRLSL